MSIINCAAQTHMVDLIEVCIRDGGDVDSSDYNGCTPVCIACRNEYGDVVDLLVKFHCNINVRDLDGNSPIFEAATHANTDIIRTLVKHGCKLRHCYFLPEKTPLYGAVHALGKPLTAVKETILLLIEAGCNPNQEEWLREAQIPDSISSDQDFCDWLVCLSRQPLSLQQLCRQQIREDLGEKALDVAEQLPLPRLLNRYISLEDL